jgi:hypothetical protein
MSLRRCARNALIVAPFVMTTAVMAAEVAAPQSPWRAEKQQLADNNLESRSMRGAELSRWLDGEYAATPGVMADLGLIKR